MSKLPANFSICTLFSFFLFFALAASTWADDSISEKQREFFESHIRPVLVEHCYQCHNSADVAEGELALDHRAALRKGGASGAAVVPGKPQESRLLKAIRHEIEGLKMPEGGPKLDAQTIVDFEKWIAMGAPDPRDKPLSAGELSQAASWEAVFAKRMKW